MKHLLTPPAGRLAAIFLCSLALHLFGSWAFPLVDRDEPRFAEASREMIERGDFVTPHFNGQYRFDKPPLIYWLQAGCYMVFGETEFAARFPSALAAAAAATLIALFAERFSRACGDPAPLRAGVWAALLFTFSLQVIIHAKAAVADMTLIAFIAFGYWSAWELARAKGRFAWGWFAMLVAALALGFLAKGPIAWAPLLLLGLALGAQRRGKTAAYLIPASLALSLAIVAIWGVPALAATRGEFFDVGIGKHVIQRGISAQEGHGSANLFQYFLLLPFYFVTIFLSFLPWSPALPGWIRAVFRGGVPAPERPLLWTALAIFLLFSLYKTKLPHYTLPAFPLISILLARHLLAVGRSDCWLRSRALAMALLVLFVAVAGPFAGPLFPSKQVAAIAGPHLAGKGEFGSTDYREPSLVWYMRGKTSAFHRVIKPRDAAAFLEDGDVPRVLVASADSAAAIAGLEKFPILGEVKGVNLARGRPVHLRIYAGAPRPAEINPPR